MRNVTNFLFETESWNGAKKYETELCMDNKDQMTRNET